MTQTKRTYLALLAVLLSPMAANADLVYEQGNIDTVDRGAYQYISQILADDFTALASGTIDSLTWTGSYYGAQNLTGSESFTFNLYAGGAAVPGALLFSSVGIASIVASATPTYFDYAMSLVGGPTVALGTSYWAAIYSNDSPLNYAWANSSDGSPVGAVTTNNGVTWGNNSNNLRSNHVFAINSVSVPEPGTLALLGIGLFGMGLAKRVLPRYHGRLS